MKQEPNFANYLRKYSQETLLKLYNIVLDENPSTVVELGYGHGGVTSAVCHALSEKSKIFGYDVRSPVDVISNLRDRNILSNFEAKQGNVFDTFVAFPFPFDMLIIDIDNTWEIIHQITKESEFINQQIINGAKVIIEGGADSHPRINANTLQHFHDKLGRRVFHMEHISGPRTSLSILTLIDEDN